MSIGKLDVLQEIYEMCLQDRNDENEKIKNNLNSISEINAYLDKVKNKSDSDHHIFSPRKEENYFQDKITLYEEKKSDLENENQFILLKVKKINDKIYKINQLMEYMNHIGNKSEQNDIQSEAYNMIHVQEKERQRIANELHDSSIQDLTHLVHMVELSSMYIDQDPIRAKLELENCIQFLKSIIAEVREIIFDLRPMTFDDLGFKQCIDNLIANIKNEFKNFEIEYYVCELNEHIFHKNDAQINNLFLVTIYRIIHEAIMNALKHSNGSKIILNVEEKDGKCFINVRDDGRGFCSDDFSEKEDKHFGMSLMKERVDLLNGTISINTELEKGTEIQIQIPLN